MLVFKTGDCAGQGRCWSLPSCCSNYERFQMCKWEHCLWKTASFFQKCLDHGMHLITQPVHILPCSNSAMKGNNGPTEYCIMILLPKPTQNRIVGFLGCSPNVNSTWCREQREGRPIWPHRACISICLMSRFHGRDTIVYTSDHYLRSSRETVFVEKACKMGIRLCCSSFMMIITHCSSSHLLSSHGLCIPT
jgi:hypothetical protein